MVNSENIDSVEKAHVLAIDAVIHTLCSGVHQCLMYSQRFGALYF